MKPTGEWFRQIARPGVFLAREALYRVRFKLGHFRLKKKYGSRVCFATEVAPARDERQIFEGLQAELKKSAVARLQFCAVSLSKNRMDGQEYWEAHKGLYSDIGSGREKALEHALTFKLFDFKKVVRYCDVAAAKSPIEKAVHKDWPQVEFWKQDCLFETNLEKKIVGGFAQKMEKIPDGFFDLLTLHCAFEHFFGNADRELMKEVDRVLSDQGACLIAPLYMDLTAKIFLDPVVTPMKAVENYDLEASLCSTFNYRQDHGRYYSPSSLIERVIKELPDSLNPTWIQFSDQEKVGEGIYLRFALVLHRKNR